MRRPGFRRALVFAVNVGVFCVVAELLALGIFYYEHGWLFYVDPYRPTIARIEEGSGDAVTAVGLHPYLGPTHRTGIPFDLPAELRTSEAADHVVATKNFGFPSRVN